MFVMHDGQALLFVVQTHRTLLCTRQHVIDGPDDYVFAIIIFALIKNAIELTVQIFSCINDMFAKLFKKYVEANNFERN